ncbi:hypothetical protein ACVIYL_008701 [Bradyrhizobium sp. USDA 3315]
MNGSIAGLHEERPARRRDLYRAGAPVAGMNFVARLECPELMAFARKRLRSSQLWGNPDRDRKTRKWEEVRPALVNMVAAAREPRVASAPVDR